MDDLETQSEQLKKRLERIKANPHVKKIEFFLTDEGGGVFGANISLNNGCVIYFHQYNDLRFFLNGLEYAIAHVPHPCYCKVCDRST